MRKPNKNSLLAQWMKRADRGAGGDLKATNKQKEKATPAVRQSKRRLLWWERRQRGLKRLFQETRCKRFRGMFLVQLLNYVGVSGTTQIARLYGLTVANPRDIISFHPWIWIRTRGKTNVRKGGVPGWEQLYFYFHLRLSRVCFFKLWWDKWHGPRYELRTICTNISCRTTGELSRVQGRGKVWLSRTIRVAKNHLSSITGFERSLL